MGNRKDAVFEEKNFAHMENYLMVNDAIIVFYNIMKKSIHYNLGR